MVLPSGFYRLNLWMRIFRLQSLGIFRLQSFGVFRLETLAGLRRPAGSFARDFSLGNFRLRSSASKVSIGRFRFGSSAWELSLESFRLGSFVWERSLWNFRFGTFALVWELSRRNLSLETFVSGNFRLGTFALIVRWEIVACNLSGSFAWKPRPACVGWLGLSLGMFRLGIFVEIVRFESFDWTCSLGIFRLGTFA